MSLKERFKQKKGETLYASGNIGKSADKLSLQYVEVKNQLSTQFLEGINAIILHEKYNRDEQRILIAEYLEKRFENNYNYALLSDAEKQALINDLFSEVKSFGPINNLYSDINVTEILIDGPGNIFVEKSSGFEPTTAVFENNEHLMKVFERIFLQSGKKIDKNSSINETTLPDGTKVSLILPPVAVNGPYVSIKKFNKEFCSLEKLYGLDFSTKEILAFLQASVKTKANIIISGAPRTGKTTLLKALCNEIPGHERVVMIEEFASVGISHSNTLKFEAAPLKEYGENSGDLIKSVLKMNPDRLILSECVSTEAFELFEAVTSGYNGIITTVAARSVQEAAAKLQRNIRQSLKNPDSALINNLLVSSVDLLVHLEQAKDGTKRIKLISQFASADKGGISIQTILDWIELPTSQGQGKGTYVNSGIVPEFITRERPNEAGFKAELFDKKYKHGIQLQKEHSEIEPLSAKPPKDSIKSRLKRPV